MSAPRDNGERSSHFSGYHLSPAPSVRSTGKSARSEGATKRWACMLEKVVANFPPMKLARGWVLGFCAFAILISAFGQTLQPEAIRPTGVPTPVEKVDAATPSKQDVAKAKKDDTATPKVKRPRSKTKRAASTPREETLPPTSGGVPSTGAKSVMMVDARTGQTLYEKNADEIRQAASTQKLLTALIIAEHGLLDQPVRVESIDTMAEPVATPMLL